MKALILSGGKGTSLKPLTNTVTKQLIPVANRPILFYAIDQIREAGIDDIGIVISPETGHFVRDAVGDGSKWSATISYIVQPEPLGLAHAVKTAQGFLGESSFVMHLGDTLIEANLHPFIDRFKSNNLDSLVLLQKVTDISVLRITGVVEVNELDQVVSLEEKPQNPKSDLALVGVYIFSSAVHEAISGLKPSLRNELEITDAIQALVTGNKNVEGILLNGWWLDTGKKDDLLEANRAVLDGLLTQDIQGNVDSGSSITGRVEIRAGTIIEKSVIRGPASIAEHCYVKDSFIGPFTSIGRSTTINMSSLEHSVVLDSCNISCIDRLTASIIGNDVTLTKSDQRFKAIRLFMGDNAKIEL